MSICTNIAVRIGIHRPGTRQLITSTISYESRCCTDICRAALYETFGDLRELLPPTSGDGLAALLGANCSAVQGVCPGPTVAKQPLAVPTLDLEANPRQNFSIFNRFSTKAKGLVFPMGNWRISSIVLSGGAGDTLEMFPRLGNFNMAGLTRSSSSKIGLMFHTGVGSH